MSNPHYIPPALVESFTERLDTRIAYDSNGNPEYVGCATSGTATTATAWAIKKLGYSSGAVVTVLWANKAQFNCAWDDRASYTYGP